MRRVLLIAFQYPPMSGTSGVQRALRFSQYLPDFGWEPIVLTAWHHAYQTTSEDQTKDIPANIHVERAFALDAARHLSLLGTYPRWLAEPDRWSTWWWSAVPRGLRLIERFRPDALWSTFPIPTAHRIGLTLQRRTGLPWIADFRDVMTEEDYPADPRLARSWARLERDIMLNCSRAVFTTPGAAQMYADRYAELPRERFTVIENGYDERLFLDLDRLRPALRPAASAGTRKMRLVHSGVIYPSERNPEALFQAMRDLRQAGELGPQDLEIVLRACGHESHIGRMAQSFGLSDMVTLAPAIPYREALAEMMSADGLLVLQGANCSRQVPAKVYEYLRTGRPILALATGDTASVVRSAGIGSIAPLESARAIRDQLMAFLQMLRNGNAPGGSEAVVQKHSRRHKTRELSELLLEVAAA